MSTLKLEKPKVIRKVEKPSEPRTFSVEALLGPRGEAFLDHRGEIYRLRTTSRGRLILTK